MYADYDLMKLLPLKRISISIKKNDDQKEDSDSLLIGNLEVYFKSKEIHLNKMVFYLHWP